ncbi:MAG: hypothetical protein KGZ58_11275 [Ignavibacteriales bacterium]|nr:hypothetical protein [Ignavibacteriales bacterium]
MNQREFSLRTLDSLSTVDLTKIDFPHMIAIAPNGQKVVAYGYAEMCQDDYCSVFLYDFQECKVFELFGVGLYLPSFNGFAWLNNELLLVVGIYFRFTREGEIETVAPSVTLYDFKLMNVRTLVGGFISREKYFKNRDNRVMIEPDLMLNLK